MSFPYKTIEKKLGYVFSDKRLLMEAFTHSSYANAHGGKDNERMEYLGDSVLQLIVTEWQYKDDVRADEGKLTRDRQEIVCEEALLWAVEKLEIKDYLLIEGGRANIGKKTISSLFETVTAAIYLDGGYQAAQKFVLDNAPLRGVDEEENFKGALQEYLQKRGETLPVYECKKLGKDNAPLFVCEARARNLQAVGEGRSKKLAEQAAAEKLLAMFTKREK